MPKKKLKKMNKENIMIECKLCNQQLENQILFSSHLRHKHNMKYQEYYDSFLKKELDGKCLVCGKNTKFERGKYRDYCCVSCMRKSTIIQEKTRATCIQKHGGVGLASKSIKEKAKKTNIEKYGVENPFMTNEAKQKAHSKESKEKFKQTMLVRYGVENPMQLDANKQKVTEVTHTSEANAKRVESTKQSNLSNYGVEYNFQRFDVIQNIKNSRSKRQQDFCIKNECTPLTELIHIYGTGWYQSNLEIDSIVDGNTKYIKNYEIDKIKQY